MSITTNQLGAGLATYIKYVIVNGNTSSLASESNVGSLISSQIKSGSLPYDSQGVYLVITDQEKSQYVALSNKKKYSSHFCGYHTYITSNGYSFAFGVIGVGNNEGGCRWQISNTAYTTYPSGNMYTDYSYSIVAHELGEIISDPRMNKWYDSQGHENFDKCNGYPGAANVVTSGSKYYLYNAVIGDVKYFLSTNYDNVANTCIAQIW